MKPLFTVHGGEYLVGSYIEQHYKHVNVWIPSRDTGVDLLVSDRRSRHALSLQVKFSKDFLATDMGAEFQKDLRACGWWAINRARFRSSPGPPSNYFDRKITNPSKMDNGGPNARSSEGT
jgi:hypothetical protein